MDRTVIWLRWLIGMGGVLLVATPGMAGPVTAATAGSFHTCALTSGGGVLCWGRNDFGQLGDGTTTQRLAPVAVSGLSSGVTAVAAGQFHTCAVTRGGGVSCWGWHGSGQLGDNTSMERHAPVAVSGLSSGITAVAVGSNHTCALTSGGGVVCWGLGGKMGDGTPLQRLTPVAVTGLSSGVTAIAVGFEHTCALTSAGAVSCWGFNPFGVLGDGTIMPRLAPVPVSGLSSGVTAIATGLYHTCALNSGGGVVCWGWNIFGQLGDGTPTQRLTPVPVSGLSSGVTAIGGGYHTCALTSGGDVRCWGRNDLGELGDGTNTQRLTSVAVSGLPSGVTAVAVGENHTCAVTSGGGLWCWGWDAFGQLGDGTLGDVTVGSVTNSRYLPVTVRLPVQRELLADFDMDHKSDLPIWRATTGTWFWLTSLSNYATQGQVQWGNQSLGDVPMLADIDGDAKADLVVWRASTGTWYWLTSSTGYSYASAGSKAWGNQSLDDVPMLADMDGDTKADLVVWRASTGMWFWLTSSTGYNYANQDQKQWGNQSLGDVPMLADIDGDAKADLVVWRGSTGTSFWLTSSSGYNYASQSQKLWGNRSLGDVPMLADMDGDGKADLVVWRSSTGTWYWLTSSTGYSYASAGSKQWGNAGLGDVP